MPGTNGDTASQRPAGRIRPLQEFLSTATAGASMLLIAAVIALAWANSPWGESYERFWQTELALRLGGYKLGEDLRYWVNDGLMSLFFLVVGLEIKREFLTGELRDRRAAALPVIAALGGMLAPALIYAVVNAGRAGAPGWGIPTATDIAFALAVLTLASRHAPANLKPFLLTTAIVDDIGSIVLISVFFSGGIGWGWLGAVALLSLAMVGVQRVQVRPGAVFMVLGPALWLAMSQSGVHPAIAGVLVGLLIPVADLRLPLAAGPDSGRTSDASPLHRVEHRLLPWVSFAILPLFALANAGVSSRGAQLSSLMTSPVAIGIVLGRVVGKTIGITLAGWLAVRLGVARLPSGVYWRHIVGAAAIAGIGFAVSLVVVSAVFTDPLLVAEAKLGILMSAVLAGLSGYAILRFGADRRPTQGE